MTFRGSLFLSKKAQLGIVFLMGALALLAIVSLIFSIAQKSGDSEEVVKAVFAEEVRLALNSLISVPGDGLIQLPQNEDYNITEFTVSLHNGYVEVCSSCEIDYFTARKGFHLPEDYEARGTVKEQEIICLVKDAKVLRLEDCD